MLTATQLLRPDSREALALRLQQAREWHGRCGCDVDMVCVCVCVCVCVFLRRSLRQRCSMSPSYQLKLNK